MELIDLERKYNKLVYTLKQKGIKISDIFSVTNKYNKDILLAILEICNNNIEDGNYIDVFKNLLDHYKEKTEGVYINITSEEAMINTLMTRFEKGGNIINLDIGNGETYPVDGKEFYSEYIDVMSLLNKLNWIGYFEVQNGKLVPKNLEASVEDLNEVNKLVKQSTFGLYEAIITKDGSVFVSLSDHVNLASFLVAIGEDIAGALRVSQMPIDNKYFSLSSCVYMKDDIEAVKNDKIIRITEGQARSLYKFFKALKSEKKANGQSLFSLISTAGNLGYNVNYDLKVAKQNMLEFEDACEGEFDSKELYERVVFNYREAERLRREFFENTSENDQDEQ